VLAAGAGQGLAGWRWAACAALLATVIAVAGVAWWRSRTGRLDWRVEGAWRWHSEGDPAGEGEAGTPVLCLDLQRWMLMRWQPAQGGRGHWFWVEAHRSPSHWRALRRAVYSPAGVDAASAAAQGRPPAAEP